MTFFYDCDPGQDDAIALMMMLAHAGDQLAGISVVGGNVCVDRCAVNAQKILELCGYGHIPVYKGAKHPLKRQLTTLEHVFGESGMAGGDDLPEPALPVSEKDGVQAMIDCLRSATDGVILVATGPLTNVALAMQQAPDIIPQIKQLVIMGGCPLPEPLHGAMGNFPISGSPHLAEYNFAMDPEAAAIVLQSGVRDILLTGLNITRAVLYNHVFHDRLMAGGTISQRAATILATVGPEDIVDYADQHQIPNDPVRAIHDAVAVGFMMDPTKFASEQHFLRIVLDDPQRIGQSLIVPTATADSSKFPITISTRVDHSDFMDILCQSLQTLEQRICK